MKIMSPVDSELEVGPLVDAGASELYGGYLPEAWVRKYSVMGSANQRYFMSAQIKGISGLKGIARSAHKRGAKFFLALNAPYYLESQYDDLLKDARRFWDIGVDAFIVADVGLCLRLQESCPGAGLHLSTLGTVFNSLSARFFRGLGIRRMVLPRELAISEMAGIIKANPDVSFDAFIMVGKCPNIEGFCSFTHNDPSLVWPCEEHYRMDVVEGDRRAGGIIKAQKGWSAVNRRQACGLCAVSRLGEAGVHALKLVGRGGPTKVKVKVTGATRKMMDLAGGGMAEDGLRRAAKGLYREAFGKDCNPYICYFPELWR